MFRKILKRLIPVAVLTALVGVASVFGQAGGTGNITGIVTDSTGAVVRGANVTATSKATGQSLSVMSNGDGVFNFVLLQPGVYSIKTTAASFGDSNLEVTVQVGRTSDANVTLTAGSVSAVVQVTADGIQTTTNNFDAIQNEAAIQNLPINGRRFQDFVTLTPAAQVDPSRGQIALSGQRGINSNVSVDGVDYNQPFFGGIRGGERSNSAFTLPQESVKEFQVVAAGYSAEFGRSSGGVVNAVTKSGSNEFRGSAFILWRPEQLALGNEFSEALAEQKLNALNIPATLAPTQTQFGGSIGGPIVKNRAFFFASYEQQKYKAPRAVAYTNLVGVTPTAVQTEPFNAYKATEVKFDQTNDAKAVLGKIDINLNDSNRFNVRYNHSRNTALNGVSTGETSLDPTTNRSVGTNGTEGDRNNIVVGQLVSTFSSNLINEARFQWAKEERPRLGNVNQVSVTTGIGELGTRTFLPTTQDDKRYQIMDSLTLIKGGHTIKFGGEYSKIKVAQSFGFNQFGNYTFQSLNGASDILNALSATAGTPAGKLGRFDVSAARYNQQIGNLAAAFDITELAFFGQDSWRATQKLTINFGMRYEKQYNPTAEANNTAVINRIKATAFPLLSGRTIDPTQIPDSQNEWGPRLGFAYDVMGNGKTVLRAYSGIYYARTPAIVLAAPFNNFRTPAGDLTVQLGPGAFNSSTFNQATFDAANPQYVAIVGAGQAPNTVYRQMAILGLNLNSFTLSTLPTLTPAQLQTIADRIQAARTGAPSTLGVFQNANVIGITPNFKNPTSYQFGGGVEHEWFRDLYLGFDFSYVRTLFLQRNIDINIPAIQSFDPVTQRPIINRNTVPRPVSDLGTIQLRDSSAASLYRAVTARIRYFRKWGQINAFYTWSKSESDDDNERDSGGVLYDNPYSRSGEFYASRLDRTHQFVASPVFYLKYGVEVSSSIRLRSGNPINAIVGSDLNGDGNTNERPYLVPGVELPRNYYRNRSLYDVDLRIQKSFSFGETRKLTFSGELFNVLNRANIQIAQSNTNTAVQYCRNGVEQPGQAAAAALSRCGLDGITSSNFLQIRDTRKLVNGVANANYGKILTTNNPGSQVFQVQLGARFYF